MKHDTQTRIRLALETALRCCDRVVVTHSIAPPNNATISLDLEVWDVDDLPGLDAELRRVLTGVVESETHQTLEGTCQEMMLVFDVGVPTPTRRELQAAVEAISGDVLDRLADESPGRLISVSTHVDSLCVSIEVSR